MVLIRSRTWASPSSTIFSGVSASVNKAGVALLTPASVACADSTTATNSVNGLTYCKLGTRVRIGGREAAERFLDLGWLVHCGSAPWAALASALRPRLAALDARRFALAGGFRRCLAEAWFLERLGCDFCAP